MLNLDLLANGYLCDVSQNVQQEDIYNPASIAVTVLIIFIAVYLMLKYYYKQW